MKVKGDKRYYGEAIGIARFDQKHRHPNIPGDVENASTYPFPVRIKIIEGLFDNPYPPLQDENGNYTDEVQKTIRAVKELEADGVRAIVMACGFFALVQDVLVREVDIPVFTSPLLMVPMLSSMISRKKKVGIISASKKLLSPPFLEAAGISPSIYLMEGLEDSTEFYACFMGGSKTTMDVDLLEREVVDITTRFVRQNPEIGILLLECSALPPYSAAIQRATGLPVFDYIGFIHCIYRSVVQQEYSGIL